MVHLPGCLQVGVGLEFVQNFIFYALWTFCYFHIVLDLEHWSKDHKEIWTLLRRGKGLLNFYSCVRAFFYYLDGKILGTKFPNTVNPNAISFDMIKENYGIHNFGSSKHPKYAFNF